MSFNNSSICTNASCSKPITPGRTTIYREPEELRTFRLAVFGVALLAALAGNFMVIKAILGKRRTPFSYCLVTNLAVGEIIASLCTLFMITYVELGSWVFGDFLCNTILPLQNASLTVVTTTIAIISIRRYQVVSGNGMNFPSSRRGNRLVIAGTWLYSFVVCLPLFIYYEVVPATIGKTRTVFYCIQRYPDEISGGWFKDTAKTYSLVRVVLCFVIQVVIMVVSYGAVTINIKKQVRTILRNARPRVDSNISNTRITDSINDIHRSPSPPTVHEMMPVHENMIRAQEDARESPEVKALLDQEGDLTRMFYVIVLIFIIFYLPYQVLHLIELFKYDLKEARYIYIVRKYFFLISCFPSALHPLCYGTMSRFYAMAFKRIVLCKCSVETQ